MPKKNHIFHMEPALAAVGGASPCSDLFLIIGHGESYETKLCRQDQVVQTIAGMIYEQHEDMPWEEREQWTADLNNETMWSKHHPDLGPVHFRAGIGETDWIDIWRVLHDPNDQEEPRRK